MLRRYRDPLHRDGLRVDTHPHPLSTFAARLTENLDEVEKLQTV